MQKKESLRASIIQKIGTINSQDLENKSLIIKNKLLSQENFLKATCVAFYVSMPTEVDTRGMIDEALKLGKRVLVPLSNLENKELSLYEIFDRRKDLKKGAFGIMEPSPEKARLARLDEADCVIVPGVVFDKQNHRIGHGGGFYDRFLSRLSSQVPKIGLAFSFQVVQEIPAEAHDIKLDMVLTD
jgi:5-formyltetrahydrofolate cyclo-ligase